MTITCASLSLPLETCSAHGSVVLAVTYDAGTLWPADLRNHLVSARTCFNIESTGMRLEVKHYAAGLCYRRKSLTLE